MKWNRMPIVAILALLLTATSLVGTATGDQAAEKARPFKISLEFAGSIIGPPGSLGCDPASAPGEMVGGGHATHMGVIGGVAGFVCQNLDTGALTNGAAVYTVANGDTVTMAFAGQAYVDPDGTFTGDGSGTVLGGTGRFTSASGDWTWTMTGTFLPDGTTQTALEGDGWIAYDASDRSN